MPRQDVSKSAAVGRPVNEERRIGHLASLALGPVGRRVAILVCPLGFMLGSPRRVAVGVQATTAAISCRSSHMVMGE
jgi:hypothetical protein